MRSIAKPPCLLGSDTGRRAALDARCADNCSLLNIKLTSMTSEALG
jgi:hypothetical protein